MCGAVTAVTFPRHRSYRISSTARAISLFLGGNTRIGKTSWIRSLGSHSYFHGSFNIDEYVDGAMYHVWDEFVWKFLPQRRSWFSSQLRIGINPKYGKPRTLVIGGAPSIFLYNADNDPYLDMLPAEKDFINGNVKNIWLTKALFE